MANNYMLFHVFKHVKVKSPTVRCIDNFNIWSNLFSADVDQRIAILHPDVRKVIWEDVPSYGTNNNFMLVLTSTKLMELFRFMTYKHVKRS